MLGSSWDRDEYRTWENQIRPEGDEQSVFCPCGSSATRSAWNSRLNFRIFHINDIYELDQLPLLKAHVHGMGSGSGCRNVVTTVAGDFVAPSLLSSLDQGTGMIACMNQVPVDIVCFGNHEADIPVAALSQRIREFQGAWINSNMRDFGVKLPEYHVVELRDNDDTIRKVIFLGLVLGKIYRKGAFGGAAETIRYPVEVAIELHDRALAEHPDAECVIPLTHQDLDDDVKLAETGLFPVILAGHDHFVHCQQHGACHIIKAGQDACNVCVVDLVWPLHSGIREGPKVNYQVVPLKQAKPKKGEVVLKPWQPMFPPDTEMIETVAFWQKPAEELKAATLMEFPPLSAPLSSIGTRFHEATMATLIATALRDALEGDAGLINGGAIRGERDYEDGKVTFAHLNVEVPYPSSVIVVSIDGQTLSDAVKVSRRKWLEQPGEENNQGLHMDSSMKVDEQNNVVMVAAEPLIPDHFYHVAIDAHVLRRNPVFSQYCERHPERIPADDSGQPALPTLVKYFCMMAWRRLIDMNEDGCVSEAEIDWLVESADANKDGRLDEAELVNAIRRRMGGNMASGVLAKRMLSLVDVDHHGFADARLLKRVIVDVARKQQTKIFS